MLAENMQIFQQSIVVNLHIFASTYFRAIFYHIPFACATFTTLIAVAKEILAIKASNLFADRHIAQHLKDNQLAHILYIYEEEKPESRPYRVHSVQICNSVDNRD
jgi:hypothetical protein